MRVISIIFAIIVMGSIGESEAQAVTCSDADAQCLEAVYLRACKDDGSSQQSCQRWLSSLEERLQSEQDAELAVAAGYTAIALADASADIQQQNHLRAQAREFYLLAYSWDSTSASAIYGLSATSESPEEKSEWRKRILDLNPEDSFASRLLLGSMQQAFGREGVMEALEYMVASYELQDAGPEKWALASKIHTEYSRHEQSVRAESFLESVRRDANHYELLSQVDRADSGTAALAIEGSSSLCNIDLVALLGEESCLDFLAGLLGFFRDSNTLGDGLVDMFSQSVRGLLSNATILDMVRDNWREELAEDIQTAILVGEPGSAEIYSVYAYLMYMDETQSIPAARRAVELAPNDPDYIMHLGQLYVSHGRGDEAVSEFSRARALLPTSQHSTLDQWINTAEQIQ